MKSIVTPMTASSWPASACLGGVLSRLARRKKPKMSATALPTIRISRPILKMGAGRAYWPSPTVLGRKKE